MILQDIATLISYSMHRHSLLYFKTFSKKLEIFRFLIVYISLADPKSSAEKSLFFSIKNTARQRKVEHPLIKEDLSSEEKK